MCAGLCLLQCKGFFSFIVSQCHVNEIIYFVLFVGGQRFNIFHPANQVFIHNHLIRMSDQVIYGNI